MSRFILLAALALTTTFAGEAFARRRPAVVVVARPAVVVRPAATVVIIGR